jgi:hypothetical protein
MTPTKHTNPGDALLSLLDDNHSVTILVKPEMCSGLQDFPPGKPLRLDLSNHFPIPMNVRMVALGGIPLGVQFSASFSRVSREVLVPWHALLWAGVPYNERAGEQVANPVMSTSARPAINDPAPTAATQPTCLCVGEYGDVHTCGLELVPVRVGNVVHVDFAARRRKS